MIKLSNMLLISLLLSPAFNSCVEVPGEMIGTITFISAETYGCIQNIPTEQMSDEGILIWQYERGSLDLFVHVDTHCETKMTDSVKVEENLITIMLEDTAAVRSECACKFREAYYFRVDEYLEVKVQCYFKPINSESFNLVIDRTLSLEPINSNN